MAEVAEGSTVAVAAASMVAVAAAASTVVGAAVTARPEAHIDRTQRKPIP